jgi:hypothetical protein
MNTAFYETESGLLKGNGMNVKTNLKAGQGLGDTIAALTHSTGIDQLAGFYEKTTGKSCGCNERRQALNELFPNTPFGL